MTKTQQKKCNALSTVLRLHWLVYLVVSISFAQDEEISKKHFYFDETWRRITAIEYHENSNVQFNLPVQTENDTAIIERLIPRATYGFMKRETRLDLIAMLRTISGRKFDEWSTVVVNFHFKKENSIKDYISQKSFIKKMQRTFTVEQFFITEKNYGYKKDNVVIYEDKFDGIRRLLFNDYFKGDNYAIIKPNGQYYRYYGEYDMSKIFGQAITDWSFDFNYSQKLKDGYRNSLPVKFIRSSQIFIINPRVITALFIQKT